jgi:hypothetical protein
MQPASSLLKRGEPLDVGIPSGIKPKEEQQRRNLRMLPTSVAAIKRRCSRKLTTSALASTMGGDQNEEKR